MNASNESRARPIAEMIKHSPLGKELTDAQCETLAQIATTRSLKDGDLLFKAGNQERILHVIVTGSLKAVRTTPSGEALNLYDLYAGEFAGIMGFMDGLSHGADLQAIRECEVFSLSWDRFEALQQRDPDLVFKVMRAILRTTLAILQRMDLQFTELTNYVSKQHGRY